MRPLLLSTLAACAPPAAGTFSTETLSASATGRTYTLSLFEPDAMSAATPVVYLLDGDDWTEDTAHAVALLAADEGLPAPLVVGIGYGEGRNHRARDYTPPGPGVAEGEGEVDAFLDFVQDDLVPFVDEGWDTEVAPVGRVIAGHSFGGVGAFWAQLTRPEVFGGSIALSPSLAFGDTAAFVRERAYAQQHDDLAAHVYLAAGSQEAFGLAGLTLEMGEVLGSRGYPSLVLETELLEGRYHAATFPEGIENGLRHTLGGAR
jgi:predicted alpha/beta superfamily hydrolase